MRLIHTPHTCMRSMTHLYISGVVWLFPICNYGAFIRLRQATVTAVCDCVINIIAVCDWNMSCLMYWYTCAMTHTYNRHVPPHPCLCTRLRRFRFCCGPKTLKKRTRLWWLRTISGSLMGVVLMLLLALPGGFVCVSMCGWGGCRHRLSGFYVCGGGFVGCQHICTLCANT